MTKDDKRRAIISGIRARIDDEMNRILQYPIEDIRNISKYVFLLTALTDWVSSDTFLKEKYPTGEDILDDSDLNILMHDQFDFVFNFMYMILQDDSAYCVGLYFSDKVIKLKLISVFDSILYGKEQE